MQKMKKKKIDYLTRGLGVLVLLSFVFNWDTFVFLFADMNPIWPQVLLLIIGLCGLLTGILLLRLQISGFFLFYVYLFCGLIFF
ncbi:membrane protein [Beggiatoa sp. SS]|nr:membrane protein [Beggiatoa sp. SS]